MIKVQYCEMHNFLIYNYVFDLLQNFLCKFTQKPTVDSDEINLFYEEMPDIISARDYLIKILRIISEKDIGTYRIGETNIYYTKSLDEIMISYNDNYTYVAQIFINNEHNKNLETVKDKINYFLKYCGSKEYLEQGNRITILIDV